MKKIPTIAPFRGLRFNPEKVDLSRVMAPPYDVISPAGQEELYARDPHNIVRLILGRQSPKDSPADNRYTRAARDLSRWTQEGILAADTAPCFYLYEQNFSWEGKVLSRRGFMALRKLETFAEGKIRPHEKTLPGPKQDRLQLMQTCRANLSPIFSLYSDPDGKMAAPFAKHFQGKPEIDLLDEEKIRHRLWCINDQGLFYQADEILGNQRLFIADGHHRYETAVNYREIVRKERGNLREASSVNYVMMFFSEMSDPGLLILPTHRVLTHRPGFDPKDFPNRLKEKFEVQTFSEKESFLNSLSDADGDRRAIGMILKGKFYLLGIPRSLSETAHQVDTVVLHKNIFQELLGFQEEDHKNPATLKFVKEADEAIAAADDPGTDAAFLLNSVPISVLKEIAEVGIILPPKTTFFYPKLLTGLVINPLDPDRDVTV